MAAFGISASLNASFYARLNASFNASLNSSLNASSNKGSSAGLARSGRGAARADAKCGRWRVGCAKERRPRPARLEMHWMASAQQLATKLTAADGGTAGGSGEMAIVLTVTAACAAVWWFAVVPSERARLARRKRRPDGDVRKYLEELRNEPERRAERWFYSEWLRKLPPSARDNSKENGDPPQDR
mmetsp:Transcript_11533/g.31104  ORF Transcript_11533/g.31104 Transcript_11533/m.31104 type:complete len:186 (-) Transcript_11533:948-1505(-)